MSVQGYKLIFVGDSRTVGMKSSVPASDDVWSAEVGVGLAWMKSTGVPNIESQLSSDSIVIFLMGINDMLYVPASSYTAYINAKSTEWSSKGVHTAFVTINPVRIAGYGEITNTKILSYNASVQSGLNPTVWYIDTYSSIIGTFQTVDGLHYTSGTYQAIYTAIQENISTRISSGYLVSFPRIEIDYTKLKPFVLTIDRSSAGRNYNQAKAAGVIGVIIEGGYLYNERHSKAIRFRNPRLTSQIASVTSAGLDFGFYMPARAKTEQDCREEIYEFSFSIRKYPPALGVWLWLDFPQRVKTTNDRLLNCYYNELVRLGLKAKVGIYATEDRLKLINWSKHQKNWFLWLDDHVKSLDEIDKLLDPTFFDMEGRYT